MKRKCSLCPQIFEDTDPLFSVQTSRHNAWHDPKVKGTSRDSNFYNQTPAYKKRNTVMGIPKYEAIK